MLGVESYFFSIFLAGLTNIGVDDCWHGIGDMSNEGRLSDVDTILSLSTDSTENTEESSSVVADGVETSMFVDSDDTDDAIGDDTITSVGSDASLLTDEGADDVTDEDSDFFIERNFDFFFSCCLALIKISRRLLKSSLVSEHLSWANSH